MTQPYWNLSCAGYITTPPGPLGRSCQESSSSPQPRDRAMITLILEKRPGQVETPAQGQAISKLRALIRTQSHQIQRTNYSFLIGFYLSSTKRFPQIGTLGIVFQGRDRQGRSPSLTFFLILKRARRTHTSGFVPLPFLLSRTPFLLNLASGQTPQLW